MFGPVRAELVTPVWVDRVIDLKSLPWSHGRSPHDTATSKQFFLCVLTLSCNTYNDFSGPQTTQTPLAGAAPADVLVGSQKGSAEDLPIGGGPRCSASHPAGSEPRVLAFYARTFSMNTRSPVEVVAKGTRWRMVPLLVSRARICRQVTGHSLLRSRINVTCMCCQIDEK